MDEDHTRGRPAASELASWKQPDAAVDRVAPRGRRYHELGNDELAASEYDRAVKLAPDQDEPLLDRAIFLADMGQLKSSAEDIVAVKDLSVTLPEQTKWRVAARIDAVVRSRPELCAELQQRDPFSLDWSKAALTIAFGERRGTDVIELGRNAKFDTAVGRYTLSIASMMGDKSFFQETLERFRDAFETDDATTSEPLHVRARLQLESLCSVPLEQSHVPMLESLNRRF